MFNNLYINAFKIFVFLSLVNNLKANEDILLNSFVNNASILGRSEAFSYVVVAEAIFTDAYMELYEVVSDRKAKYTTQHINSGRKFYGNAKVEPEFHSFQEVAWDGKRLQIYHEGRDKEGRFMITRENDPRIQAFWGTISLMYPYRIFFPSEIQRDTLFITPDTFESVIEKNSIKSLLGSMKIKTLPNGGVLLEKRVNEAEHLQLYFEKENTAYPIKLVSTHVSSGRSITIIVKEWLPISGESLLSKARLPRLITYEWKNSEGALLTRRDITVKDFKILENVSDSQFTLDNSKARYFEDLDKSILIDRLTNEIVD